MSVRVYCGRVCEVGIMEGLERKESEKAGSDTKMEVEMEGKGKGKEATAPGPSGRVNGEPGTSASATR